MAYVQSKSGVYYNPDIDYEKLIQDLKNSGTPNTKNIEAMEKQRAAKIADLSLEQIKDYGVNLDDAINRAYQYGVDDNTIKYLNELKAAQLGQTAQSNQPTTQQTSQPTQITQQSQPATQTTSQSQQIASPATTENLTQQVSYSLAPQPRDYSEEIRNLAEAQRQAQLAALEKSRQQALSNLSVEKASIAPTYYNARNQVASQNKQSARNFAEYMANRGLTRSGAGAQAEIARNVAYQSNMSALGQQEAQAYQDIARRESDIENAYLSDKASINANIDANMLNQLIAEGQRLDNVNLNNYYQNQQLALSQAGLTGYYSGQRTLAGQQLDASLAQQQWQNQFALQQYIDSLKQQQWQNAFNEKQYQSQQQQQQWENEFAQAQFDYQKQRDQLTQANADREYILKLDQIAWERNENNPAVRAQILRNEAQDIENEISRIQLQYLPQQAQLEIEQLKKTIERIGKKDELSPEEQQQMKLQLEQAEEQIKQYKAAPYIEYINTNYQQAILNDTDKIIGYRYDTQAIEQYLAQLDAAGVDADIIKYLAKLYGITILEIQ